MGLLVDGQPLSSEDLHAYGKYIREHGVIQFMNLWKRLKDLQNDELKYGDELELGICVADPVNKTLKLSIRGAEIKNWLNHKEEEHKHETEGCTWVPEYGAWMVESTPSRPYSGYTSDLLRIERNMIVRRRRLLAALKDNEIAPMLTCFPVLGVGDFIHDPKEWSVPASHSTMIPDYIINPHPRFATLTRNIRKRRGTKVDIRVPLYRDTRTPEYLIQDGKKEEAEAVKATWPEHVTLEETPQIYMDAMGFGMGMCCLQVTFQARDVDESRYMYDQLVVLAPILMALTAATPIFKGRLSDIDARWTVISQAVDDRTPAERGLIPDDQLAAHQDDARAGGGICRIPKSRYDSVSSYIYHCRGDPACQRTFSEYNDIDCPVSEEAKLTVRAAGLDENLAHHIGHLFVRDPIVAYQGEIYMDDEKSSDHFENIQSTNWQSCRWKPPPISSALAAEAAGGAASLTSRDSHIGWRAEFRSMEIQFTDFENAAFTTVVVLITRVLLALDLGLYIPLSRVDENMRRAHHRNAVLTEKFFFRKHVASLNATTKANSTTEASPAVGDATPTDCAPCRAVLYGDDSFEEMTIEEIFLGKEDYYPGLLPLVYAYLDFIHCDPATMERVKLYLEFIEKRARGELITPATWIRRFVETHPDYRQDSVITPSIAYDLGVSVHKIGIGELACPELLGSVVIDPIRADDAFTTPLSSKFTCSEREALIQSMLKRATIPRQATVPPSL